MALDPLNFMFAIITDETQARRAFEELRRGGLGDDEVFVLAGTDGASWIDSIGNRPAIVDPDEQKRQQAKLANSPPEPEPGTSSGSAEPEAPAAASTTPHREPGLLTRLMRALGIEPQPSTATTPKWSDPDRYKHAAREGHFVFAVRAPEPEDQDRISRILREHGGRFINYYGRLNTTTFYR